MQIDTERLRLRRWRDSDRAPFAALNSDPAVMEFFPALLTRAESDSMIDRIEATFEERALGLFAVEERGEASFVGYVGLWPANFEAHFTPAIEIGWRLAREFWGKGYATEAARATLRDAFERLSLDEIVSFTSVENRRSQRVMEKLGMERRATDDFDHPALAADHWLAPHVLYRLRRPGSK